MSDYQKTFDALRGARVELRMAELARLPIDEEDLTVVERTFEVSMKRHIDNARAEIDEALTDLRGEGKVD